MRQAVMTAPGRIEFRDAPIPQLKAGEVLLKIERIGVCGSDVHVNHGKHPFTGYPVIQGHEFSATVSQVGEGVTGIRKGMKVTAMPQEVCGECGPCQRGAYHICDRLKVRGFQAPGVAQDLYAVEADKIVALPGDFTHEQGAMIEPTAVAVHATGRAGLLACKNVVVTGAGPIGNLVAQVAQAREAKVLVSDVSEFRLAKARDCGIAHTCNIRNEDLKTASMRAFGADGFDIALECAGVESALDSLVMSINKGGSIVAVAVYGEKPRVNMAIVGDRELTVIGTLMYQRPDYQTAVQMVDRGDVRTEPLVTNHFEFAKYLDAYKFIDEQGDKTLKVMIDL